MKNITLLIFTFCFCTNALSLSKIPLLLRNPGLRRTLSKTPFTIHKDSLDHHRTLNSRSTKKLSEAEAKKLIDDETKALNHVYEAFYAILETKKNELGQEAYAQLYKNLQIAHMERKMNIVKKYTDHIELY